MADQSTDPKPDKTIDLGVYSQPNRGLTPDDLIAIALTIIWLSGVGIYFLAFHPEDQEATAAGAVLTVIAVLLPIAMIWIATLLARTTRLMRQETVRLQASVDAMRQAYVSQKQSSGLGIKPAMEQKLDEIVASQKQTEYAIATFATTRDAKAPAPGSPSSMLTRPGLSPGDSQPTLALDTPGNQEKPPISIADFIGALNFPENENDTEGFRQLRRALADHGASRLVRASQDVLTLLSQDGIYMDDLNPDRARPEIWRKFAQGERGRTIAGLGGVHDRSSLALCAGRMRSDPIFRDSAHHFLREFDKTFAAFAEAASDEDITRLAETRTARAFMLLGRVAGTFD
ncbi:MAG: hypothetical protein HKP40_07050 [Litoreibacter sp.]|nr:hypothetical protein [Litoreibacter sp.]